jgi:hypothetical protein
MRTGSAQFGVFGQNDPSNYSTKAIAQIPIVYNSGVNTLTFDDGSPCSWVVPPWGEVNVTVVQACLSSKEPSRWCGTMFCRARRIGANALTITVQQNSGDLEVTDPAWLVQFVAVGNTLYLQVNSDAHGFDIIPRGLVQVVRYDTSADPAGTSPAALRSQFFGFGQDYGFSANQSTTPAVPTPGTLITAIGDISGHPGRNMTIAAGDRPEFLVDGNGHGYLHLTPAVGCVLLPAGAAPAGNTSHTIYWIWQQDANATPTQEIHFSTGSGRLQIWGHLNPPDSAVGTHLCLNSGSTRWDLGPMPNGLVSFTCVLDRVALLAQLYVNGVAAMPPFSYTDTAGYTQPWQFGYNSTLYGANGRLYDWAWKNAVASPAEIQLWHQIAQVAYGAP